MDILVASDNRDVFQEIKKTLERSISGARVIAWSEAEESQAARLVILDLELAGSEVVLSRIRQSSCAPVILIASHNGNPERLIDALEAGADDYLYKPLDKIELQERVKASLWEARKC